jgi:hypothetical protein
LNLRSGWRAIWQFVCVALARLPACLPPPPLPARRCLFFGSANILRMPPATRSAICLGQTVGFGLNEARPGGRLSPLASSALSKPKQHNDNNNDNGGGSNNNNNERPLRVLRARLNSQFLFVIINSTTTKQPISAAGGGHF